MDRRNFLLSSLATLGGCATGVWNLPSYDDLAPEKSGVAIASVGGVWVPNARFSVGFRPVESPTTVGEFFFLRNSAFRPLPVDIQNDPLYATVSTRRLPPGKYEIYGASVMVYMGMQTTYFDKRPFTFSFEILPGKATYLGEFLGYPVRGEEMLGVEKTIGAYFTVQDQRMRDLELLRKRGIEFRENAVLSAVMNKAQSANSIFKRLDEPL